MTEYVTLEELKQHLNVDFDDDDTYIKGLIIPAQLSVESYICQPLTDCVKEDKIDRRIWHAIRIIVANFYANRESISYTNPSVVPDTIKLLLQPLKKYT